MPGSNNKKRKTESPKADNSQNKNEAPNNKKRKNCILIISITAAIMTSLAGIVAVCEFVCDRFENHKENSKPEREEDQGEIKQAFIRSENDFSISGIKDSDSIKINENVHIDGFIDTANFKSTEEFLWVFLKLNDNYYIKPTSKAAIDSDSWNATIRWDNYYEAIAVFKVKSDGNEIFEDWTQYRFGGIKVEEFPDDVTRLGEVSINTIE